MQGVSTRNF